MNKTDYLSALKKALKDIDESVMEEIVLDYEEHFQVGMEKGKSEEQICEELGAIDDLVKEIKEVYNTDNKEDEKEEKKSYDDQTNNKNNKFKEWYSNIHNIDGEKIGDAINNALDSAGDAISKIDVNEISRTLKSTLDQATSSINNLADNYLKNQGTGPFEFNKRNAEGYKENVSKSYDDSEESEEASKNNVSDDPKSDDEPSNYVQADTENKADESEDVNSKNVSKGLNLIVDGICADITVQKSSNGKINISYENNGNERQRQMYEFYSFKEGNTVYAGIRRVGKAVFLFNLKLYSININIEIPDHMSNVNIRTASGNIIISNVNSDIIATTASGDITANNIEAKFLSLKSSSGDVVVRNIGADIIDNSSLSGNLEIANMKAGECKIRSTSGGIKINEFTMNNADVSSISGNVKIIQIIGDDLRVSNASGNITAEVNVKRCHASSKSGNVEVKCNGNIILESSSTSGNVDITLKNYNSGYCVKSRTTSGALYINYDNMCQRNLKTGTYTYGNQGSELILSSVSGDIHLAD